VASSGDGDGGADPGLTPTEPDASEPAIATRVRYRTVQVGSELGRYLLLEELGAGGMATVFRARDRELRRDVAVKVLFAHLCRNREVVSRFQREARAAAALDHRHILRVFDVGGAPAAGAAAAEPVDPPYIVLELVRGPSLEQLIASHDPPLAEVVAGIGVALCSALAEAHRAGVIHRDVKPGNVLVADDGRLVLGDFGVARVADDESSVVTRTGALLGTPAFMSPEQATGGPLDVRSDLYSLGATLYQLATGSLPVSGGAARAVAMILSGDVVPPLRRNPRIGVDLARIIERLMQVEPGDRFADAGQVEAALRDVVVRGANCDAETLVRDFFADPAAYQARLLPAVVSATVAEAGAALAAGQRVRALALADRALALDGSCRAALDLVEDIGRGRARRRAAVAALSVAVAGAATWAVLSLGGVQEEAGQGATIELATNAGGEPGSRSDAGTGSEPGSASGSEPASEMASEAGSETASEAGPETPSETRSRPDSETGSPSEPARARARARTRTRTRSPARGATNTRTKSENEHENENEHEQRAPDAGAPASPGAPATPEPAAMAPEPPAPAVVTLEMDSWCDVIVGGREFGTANPKLTFELAPGPHLITCVRSEPHRLRWSRRVELAPGERRTERGHILPAVTVTVRLTHGDSVRVRPGDKIVRSGASFGRAAGRAKVEVLRAGKRIASDWVTFRPGSPCTLKDVPAIGCY
jgi:eukaryotic-like serine/threonine-protein kinase